MIKTLEELKNVVNAMSAFDMHERKLKEGWDNRFQTFLVIWPPSIEAGKALFALIDWTLMPIFWQEDGRCTIQIRVK